jgi:DNA-binding CsgD family transcriptional regulator
LVVRACHALCLSLAGTTKQAAQAVTTFLRLVDEEDRKVRLMGVAFECAMMFAALSEVVSGRITMGQRILKRRTTDDGPVSIAMRSAVETLLHRAKTPSFQESTEDAVAVLRERGFGGYARYLEIAAAAIDDQLAGGEAVTLTPSELRVLRYLAAGLPPKEIAVEMERSVYTIQTHIQNLTEKLGTRGRGGAIAAARRLGLLEGTS